MKALAVVGCIFGAAGFLLATYSAVAPNKMPRAERVVEEGRVLKVADETEGQPAAAKKGGCCQPKAREAQKAHDCKMGCE